MVEMVTISENGATRTATPCVEPTQFVRDLVSLAYCTVEATPATRRWIVDIAEAAARALPGGGHDVLTDVYEIKGMVALEVLEDLERRDL